MNIRERIKRHDDAAIHEALIGKWSPMDSVFAIVEVCNSRLDSPVFKEDLLNLRGIDFDAFSGTSFSSIVDAACDILGFAKYEGSNPVTLFYISNGNI